MDRAANATLSRDTLYITLIGLMFHIFSPNLAQKELKPAKVL